MGHVVEVSPSGRAKCRGCKETIAKGVVRFGEAYESAFTEGEALRYWHLTCAAKSKKLAVPLEETLAGFDGTVPDRAEVDALIAAAKKKGAGKAPAKFPHAQVAANGRAGCMVCGEKLEKGTLRVAVEREVEAPMGMVRGAGYLHPGCALGWAEEQGEDPEAFTEQVLGNSELGDAERATLEAAFAG